MIDQKAKQTVLNILQSRLSQLREKLKVCQADKDCSLEIYENIVEECQQIEYAIHEMEKL